MRLCARQRRRGGATATSAAGRWPVRIWLAALLLTGCADAGPDRLTLTPVSYADLPGWHQDHVAAALPALLRSCEHPATAPAADWQRACAAARSVPSGNEAATRTLLEQQFQPHAASSNGGSEGLLTGYFEPQLEGARTPDARMRTPLLARPSDLVDVDLGTFTADLAGRRIAGRVQDGRLVPYWDRAEIEAGAWRGRAEPIVFIASPIDAFFLQIQGSGRVLLRDGTVMRVGFAGRNGRPYVAIGKVMVERGDLDQSDVSMQSIRTWLERHPTEAAGTMAENGSYVFFRELHGLGASDGPLGTLGVPLTPGRSLAVDWSHIPLGVPVWVDTADPLDGAPLQRLMLAQDTGGAIRGPLRGDVFFGWGKDAEARAGRMAQRGRLYVLLPRAAGPE